MNHVTILGVLLLTCRVAGGDPETIDCNVTGDAISKTCGFDNECTVRCPSNCAVAPYPIYGLVNYQVHSSICRSALHDLRILQTSPSDTKITLVVSNKMMKRFEASKRYGIPSGRYPNSSNYFFFISPRATEDVWDVTTLHRNFIYNKKQTSVLECHINPKRPVSFWNEVNGWSFRGKKKLDPSYGRSGVPYISWTAEDYLLSAFMCLTPTTLSDVTSMGIHFPHERPVLMFGSYTMTLSVNDTLISSRYDKDGTIIEEFRRLDPGDEMPDGFRLSRIPWLTSPISLSAATIVIFNRTEFGTAIRFIVRVCPHQIYGPLCEHTCPNCKNGGVCHDITGQCICPPGFTGELCQTACGDDRFGRHCEKRCSYTNPDPDVKSCRGILMCLPDPYGCSCGTGFTGRYCNETCPQHRYGADCKQSRVCTCKTRDSCNVYTGTCHEDGGACRDGFKNAPYCDVSYPMLLKAPVVLPVTHNLAELHFEPWNASLDFGHGDPAYYAVQFKPVVGAVWTERLVHRPTKHKVVLFPLRGGTEYEARVLVIDSDAGRREHGAPVTRFRTTCGMPQLPPFNVTIDSSSGREILIKWKNPPEDTWECWSVNVTLQINESITSLNVTDPRGQPVDTYRFPVSPLTNVTVKLRLVTPEGFHSPWTDPLLVTSADIRSEGQQIVISSNLITTIVAGVLGLLVVALAVYCLFFRKKKTPQQHRSTTSDFDDDPNDNFENVAKHYPFRKARNQYVRSPSTQGAAEDYLPMRNVSAASNSQLVTARNYQLYIAEVKTNGTIERQFTNLPRGKLNTWSIATKPANRNKNRYSSVLPYDDSRVILSKEYNKKNDGYINASYIQGYRPSEKYIATQAPLQSTVEDFWRMVWEQHSSLIVMLNDVLENGKEICPKYWPEDENDYGEVHVSLVDAWRRKGFVERELLLTIGTESRAVTHFQLSAWSVDGIPNSAESVKFLLLRIDELRADGPPVVHCSAGIGATGVFILVKNALAKVRAVGAVDVAASVAAMRHERINMVETLEQYVFAHVLLAELLGIKNHSRTKDEFVLFYLSETPGFRRSKLQKEFEELSELCATEDDHDVTGAIKSSSPKTGHQSVIHPLPGEGKRGRLSNGSKSAQDCAEVVFVDGFLSRREFVVAQLPVASTASDLWHLIVECGSRTLVTLGNLDDEITPRLWPEVGSAATFGDVTVKPVDVQTVADILVQTLSLSAYMTPAYLVKHFRSQHWTGKTVVPESPEVAVDLLHQVDAWRDSLSPDSGPIAVLCQDGCQGSGLFCACAVQCERLRVREEVNIFSCVRSIRRSRPQFITNDEQYEFCYDVAFHFLEATRTYANVEEADMSPGEVC